MARSLEWLEEGHLGTAVEYLVALAVVLVVGLETGFTIGETGAGRFALVLLAAIPAGFLLTFSLFGLITYFIFIPSISNDGHLFARVHATHLIHPLTTSIVLGLFGLCLLTGSALGGVVWMLLLAVYVIQTALIVRRLRQEVPNNGGTESQWGTGLLLLNLLIGGELVTMAARARPLAPWKVKALPPDTWVVDVRSKPEFYWNRMQAAENYPLGAGAAEAARTRDKEAPVLVVCFSGHRSPAVAVMLKRLGFKTVYNLNWGLLYFLLLQRGQQEGGPFSLTRSQRDPHRRGEDLKGLTLGYVTLAIATLVGAPLECGYVERAIPLWQSVLGVAVGIGGLTLGLLSFKALGRNFRVYAAPRRSGRLITSGVYSRVRHPMYTGVIVGLAGYIIAFGSWPFIPAWIAVTILYTAKSIKEERILAAKYPDYEEYQSRTWRFIPYVY